MKKKTTAAMRMKKDKEVIAKLQKLGKEITTAIKKGKSPTISIPVRTLSNIEFDEKHMKLRLGSSISKRSFMNVAHARKFMQTVLIASWVCNELVKEGITTSLRDMYYAIKRTIPGTKENTVEEQSESDPIVVDLETALDVLREELHLNADVRGRVVGNVVIKDRGDTVDWSKLGSGGWSIPSNVENIEFKKVDADYILLIEKNAAFERLHEDKFWKTHNCILMTSQGQAARGVRRLANRLSTEHKIPLIVFTDGDAYGWYIYSVIKWGSMNLAHVSEKLGTPNAKFVGLTMTDIERYDLEKYTIKAKDVDIKRAKELMNYPWFQAPEWQKEIKLMIKKGYKAELEALSSKGLRFITNTYLPEKIENKEFLP
ncbi:MAG: DNA topoisomerase IV subunit A [Candidatus Diapherotrites archaeon]|nr:DNA topoisomerase IV subunit A [Candidatus Diapherotrites archaeon]